MAQSYTGSFGTLIKPSSVVDQKVQTPSGGSATTGVLMLVGEATAGADVQADNISTNYFGPDELAAVIAKYQSGPLVDAFRIAQAASNDPNIVGTFTRAYLAKTNVSSKAIGSLSRAGLTAWSVIADRSYGDLGNLLNVSVTGTAEVAPTTTFTHIPSPQASNLEIRVSGGNKQTVSIAGGDLPSTVVASINGATGVLVTGGVDRGALGGVSGTLAVSGGGTSNIVITYSGTWAVIPTVGDSLVINATSAIKGASGLNQGYYIVTGAAAGTISATKLRDWTEPSAGVVTETVTATSVLATTDIQVFSPIAVRSVQGATRAVLSGTNGQLAIGTATGSTLVVTLGTGKVFDALPQAGDLVLAAASSLGVGNDGWHQVVSATSGTGAGASTLTLTRLSNGTQTTFGSQTVSFTCLKPVVDGVGKTLEFTSSGTESFALQAFTSSGVAANLLSTSSVPLLFTSATQYAAQINVARATDGLSETFLGQGDIVLKIGYHGNHVSGPVTGTMTISGTTLTTTVTGGTGTSLSVNLKNFKTLSDLVTFLGTQSGYSVSVGSALWGQMALTYTDANGVVQTVLDKATWGIGSDNGALPGQVKRDAWFLWNKLVTQSNSVQLGATLSVAPTAGQPEVQALAFLTGGARGATTQAQVAAAIDKLEKVRGNFLVPLFSRDASADIADGLTDAASTYLIDSVNSYAKSHAVLMSVPKRRKYRQAICSKKGSFTDTKLAAQNLASFRSNLAFHDFKFTDSSGTIVQFQPWAAAVNAAAMQAAGGYKAIVYKYANTSGALVADGSYSDQALSQVEDALTNGLMPLEQAPNGGYRWVSDQTTYGIDNNFVYNSLQAVYAMDTISATIAERMENAFVGQSVADVGAGVVLAYLASIMSDLKRQKLVASSDDAPLGYKDAMVKINGPVCEISVNIKLAGAIYFIPVTAFFTQVTQSAAQ